MKMKCHLLAAGVWLIRFLTHTTKAMSQTAGVFVFPFCGGTLALYEAPTNFVVSVERVGGSEGTVTVDCATSNLTATARLDYVAHSGSLTFGPGETSKPFFIPILPDSLVEPKETLLVTLSSPTGGAGLSSTNTIVLTILETTFVLEVTQANFTVTESGGSATIGVTRTGGCFDSVSVQYATGDGTATAGMDYTAQSGTLSFAFGENSTAAKLASALIAIAVAE